MTWIHIAAWAGSARTWPRFTLLLLMYYVWLAVPGYRAFFREYPWMKKYWWAAVLVDHFYVLQEPWAWLTLDDTTWLRAEALSEGRDDN